MKNRFVAAAMAVVTALSLAACVAGNGSGNGGSVPTSRPPLFTTPIGPEGVNVLFLVETFETFEGQELPIVRDHVLMVINAFDARGKAGRYTDKVTGNSMTGPQSYYQRTPWPYTATLGTGIVSVSVTAIFEGARKGDGVKCSVEVEGTLLPELGDKQTSIVEYAVVQATCLYFLPPGTYPIPVD